MASPVLGSQGPATSCPLFGSLGVMWLLANGTFMEACGVQELAVSQMKRSSLGTLAEVTMPVHGRETVALPAFRQTTGVWTMGHLAIFIVA